MKKLFYIFAIVAFTLVSCDKNDNLLETNIEPKKATANAEEVVLANAEKTIQLQNDILAKAESFLEKKNIKANVGGIQRVKMLSSADETAIIEKLDSLTNVFKDQRPEAVERLFDENNVPSGLAENDQYIIVGDDNMIDKADPDNALMLSNIVRVSKGMEPIEENSQKVKSIFKSPTGFTTSDDKRWDGGEVPYQFDSNITETERTFIRTSYNDWNTKTSGKVRFSEVSDNWWNNFCYALGFKKFIKIKKENLDAGVAGQANGCGKSAWATIKYSPNWINNYRTVVHEMGHKLGLQHEHQRPDRDNFLRVNMTGSQYDKIEEKYARFLWWRWKTRSVTYSSTYDYMSIMHYQNFWNNSINNTWFSSLTGGSISTGGQTISNTDAEFIKSIY